MRQRTKAALKLFLVSYVVIFFMLIITVPFHESLHWMLSVAEGEQVFGFHIFDNYSFAQGKLGYVMAVGAGPGLPVLVEEAIVYSIQMVVVSIASIVLIMVINEKYIKYKTKEEHAA